MAFQIKPGRKETEIKSSCKYALENMDADTDNG